MPEPATAADEKVDPLESPSLLALHLLETLLTRGGSWGCHGARRRARPAEEIERAHV